MTSIRSKSTSGARIAVGAGLSVITVRHRSFATEVVSGQAFTAPRTSPSSKSPHRFSDRSHRPFADHGTAGSSRWRNGRAGYPAIDHLRTVFCPVAMVSPICWKSARQFRPVARCAAIRVLVVEEVFIGHVARVRWRRSPAWRSRSAARWRRRAACHIGALWLR